MSPISQIYLFHLFLYALCALHSRTLKALKPMTKVKSATKKKFMAHFHTQPPQRQNSSRYTYRQPNGVLSLIFLALQLIMQLVWAYIIHYTVRQLCAHFNSPFISLIRWRRERQRSPGMDGECESGWEKEWIHSQRDTKNLFEKMCAHFFFLSLSLHFTTTKM